MFTMQEWLNVLESGHKYHICIWSGVAVSQAIGLDFFHRIHHTNICKYIKAEPRGLKGCKRCRACADVCPGHAISFPLIARKTAGAPALESTTAGVSGTPAVEPELDLDEPSEALS